jgi:hypothetical protein
LREQALNELGLTKIVFDVQNGVHGVVVNL